MDAVIPGMHAFAQSLRDVPGLGVILVGVVILATGIFVANIFGQWWLKQWTRIITRIPVVNSIYSSVKQVSDTLFAEGARGQRRELEPRSQHRQRADDGADGRGHEEGARGEVDERPRQLAEALEHPVHEAARVGCAEALGDFDRLVDRHGGHDHAQQRQPGPDRDRKSVV